MRKLLTASAATLALAGVTLGSAAPAEARYYDRGHYYGHYHGGGGTALAAGILGLAAGAAIASDHRGYYDRGYYGYAPYGYAPAYYAPPPPPGYYGGYCRSDWRWDGWAHRYVRVRYCD
jgi:hypothetical protein